jgi:hypothetical protein
VCELEVVEVLAADSSRGTVVHEESKPVTKTTRTAQMRVRFIGANVSGEPANCKRINFGGRR